MSGRDVCGIHHHPNPCPVCLRGSTPPTPERIAEIRAAEGVQSGAKAPKATRARITQADTRHLDAARKRLDGRTDR